MPQEVSVSYQLHIYSHFHTYRFHLEHEPEHKPETKTGAVFDGSFGIDTEDLVNIPTIDFSTLQYFPHQQTSGPNGEIDLFDPDNIAQNGIDWVKLHAKTGKT